MNKYWGVAIDLDGTLLNDESLIPLETRIFLSSLYKGPLIIITGRNYEDARFVVEELNLENRKNCYLVYNDGSDIIDYDSKNIVHNKDIDSDDFKKLIDYFHANCIDYTVLAKDRNVYVVNGSILHRGVSVIKFILKNKLNPNKKICFSKNKVSQIQNIVKIVVWAQNKMNIEQINASLVGDTHGDFYTVINEGIIEIKSKYSSKLAAMKIIMHKENICAEKISYFGNGGNDIECLRYFENSYVVSNAGEEVKKEALEVIASNNEQGVMKKMREWIL